jgi:hypothetical protein
VTESSRELIQTSLQNSFPLLSATVVDGLQAFGSSILANSLALLPYVPGEVVSSRLIVQPKNGLNTFQMIKQIYKESGFQGFFKGFGVSLFFASIYSFQWWWVYSGLRRYLVNIPTIGDIPILLDLASGFSAGMFATCLCHPLDTLKTRVMTTGHHVPPFSQHMAANEGYIGYPHTLSGNNAVGDIQRAQTTNLMKEQLYKTSGAHLSEFRIITEILRKEGFLTLFRGLPASMAQTAISSSGFAISYEVIKRLSVYDTQH